MYKLLALFALFSSTVMIVNAQNTFFYPLSFGFEESSGTGPDLIVILNDENESGEFGNFQLPATTCISEEVVPGYFFERDAGFEFSNNEFIDCEYTIQFAFKFDDLNNSAGWVRIMSFTHVDDVGIYIYQSDPPSNGTLDFWPNGTVGESDFFNDEDVYQLTLIRKCNGLVDIYINGQIFDTYDDSGSMQYLPQEPNDYIVFFRDHPSVLEGEASPGWTKNLYIADFAWDSTQVSNSWNHFCEDLISQVEENFETAEPILLYPNPASNMIRMNIPDEIQNTDAEVSILDMMGRTVYHKTKHLQKIENFSIESLSNGGYLIEIRHKQQIFRGRFLKNE